MIRGLFLLIFLGLRLNVDALPKKFFMMSQVKAGTHLLAVTLTELTGKKHFGKKRISGDLDPPIKEIDKAFTQGSFVRAHKIHKGTWDQLFKAGYKIVYIVRDSRARLVSRIYFRHKLQPHEWNYQPLEPAQVTELVRGYIRDGHLRWCEIEECLPLYMFDEKYQDFVCFVRFEDLVGSQGGGSDERQLITLERISNFLDLKHSTKHLQAMSHKLFGHKKSGTFRRGQIDGWRDYFDDEMIEAHANRFGRQMEQMGYSLR